jgi:hypothetical protein
LQRGHGEIVEQDMLQEAPAVQFESGGVEIVNNNDVWFYGIITIILWSYDIDIRCKITKNGMAK